MVDRISQRLNLDTQNNSSRSLAENGCRASDFDFCSTEQRGADGLVKINTRPMVRWKRATLRSILLINEEQLWLQILADVIREQQNAPPAQKFVPEWSVQERKAERNAANWGNSES